MNRLSRSLVLILTAGIIIFQLGRAGQEFEGYAKNKVWPDRSLDAISRSADVAYGSGFLAFVDFLRKEIPPDAVVVDTRTFGSPQYDDSSFLQYFLFPRTVIAQSDSSCPGMTSLMSCLQAMTGPHVFFIYGPNFVFPTSIPDTLKVLPFNASSGLLAPQIREAGQ